MEWLDENLYPKLHLDHGDIELTYQLASLEGGPNPEIVDVRVECIMPHSLTGELAYRATDLNFFPAVFAEFATDLKGVLDGNVQEARLSPIGSELVLTINRAKKSMHMHVTIKEFKFSFPDITASASGGVAIDVAYRWARELEEYGERLREWLMQREVPPGE